MIGRYAGKKKHIRINLMRTFCGHQIIQQTKEGPKRLFVVGPDFADCRVCVTNYYIENPLQLKRTHLKYEGEREPRGVQAMRALTGQ
jgi:hypothetical protein